MATAEDDYPTLTAIASTVRVGRWPLAGEAKKALAPVLRSPIVTASQLINMRAGYE